MGNKAAFLVADGGTFNGHTIAGLGLVRTARIWYRAMTAYLTPASDYLDLGDALLRSCVDLAGSGGITLASCASVQAATRATEMHLRPAAGAPRRAPVCARGRVPVDVLFDDMEDPTAGIWRPLRLAGKAKAWYHPQNPNDDPRWDATWAPNGELNLYAADRPRLVQAAMTMSRGVKLPEGAFLHFAHGFAFDSGTRRYDGGVVGISLEGGAWLVSNSAALDGHRLAEGLLMDFREWLDWTLTDAAWGGRPRQRHQSYPCPGQGCRRQLVGGLQRRNRARACPVGRGALLVPDVEADSGRLVRAGLGPGGR